jgi:hypothetical protein
LTPLHSLWTFVRCFELRIHPFAGQEPRTVFRDPVTAHQAHGLPHHVCSVSRVPQLRSRAKHVGLGILQHKLHQWIIIQFGALRIAFAPIQQFERALLTLT